MWNRTCVRLLACVNIYFLLYSKLHGGRQHRRAKWQNWMAELIKKWLLLYGNIHHWLAELNWIDRALLVQFFKKLTLKSYFWTLFSELFGMKCKVSYLIIGTGMVLKLSTRFLARMLSKLDFFCKRKDKLGFMHNLYIIYIIYIVDFIETLVTCLITVDKEICFFLLTGFYNLASRVSSAFSVKVKKKKQEKKEPWEQDWRF